MKFKNDEMKAEWSVFDNNNKDPYGAATVKYAVTWAESMEGLIAQGQSIQDIADKTSSNADTEGITGFMYGAAVNALTHAWYWGDELKAWHNKEYNYAGDGVVNPAILTVGDSHDD